MNTWMIELQRGMEYLRKHSPKKALGCLKIALSACPSGNTKEIAKIFFYLGVTLKKLGLNDSALKSWSLGRKIRKNGVSGKMYSRFCNGYGMSKQPSCDMDDFKAFYSVQLERYLLSKHSKRFGTDAEQDMIHDLILDYWKALKKSGITKGKDTAEKMSLFRSINIVFPFFVVPETMSDTVIPVHFGRKKKISQGDRCFCGSGLSYCQCCGRTPGRQELVNGLF